MSLSTKVARATSQGGMVGRVPQGDPGLFGAIGGALKSIGGGIAKVASVALPIAIPGIGGAAGGAIANIVSGGGPKPPAGLPTNLPALPTPGVGGAIQRILPGGQSGYQSAAPPKGYRLNKTGYFLKDGTYVPPESRFVKIRRRNSLNPRALSRAMSRLEGAKKASKSLSRISIRKKSC